MAADLCYASPQGIAQARKFGRLGSAEQPLDVWSVGLFLQCIPHIPPWQHPPLAQGGIGAAPLPRLVLEMMLPPVAKR